jgi:hypothetical protein
MSEVLSDLRKQLLELDAKTDEIKRNAWARENPAHRDSGQWEELPADADSPKPGAVRRDAEGPHLHPAVQEKIQVLQLDQSEPKVRGSMSRRRNMSESWTWVPNACASQKSSVTPVYCLCEE